MPGRLSRERQRFPTRNYPYRARSMEEMMAAPAALALPDANTLYRRVVGIDEEHRAMTADELALLEDPLGRLLRSGKPFPLSLRELLQALDAAGEVPGQLVFLVADGGHIPWSEETDDLQRAFRFVVARQSGGDFRLLVSSSTLIESTEDQAFLQVIGWDSTHEVFHYYERLFGTFFWAGMSPHALDPATRGKGPFDSHVNGSLVMKELRAPWIHWHAPLAGINREAFAPDDPLVNDPLFLERVTAERLETEIVRPAIRRWNASRVRKAIGGDGVWRNAVRFLRQVITDTTVNLATTDIASHLITDDTSIPPPLSFFLNRDVLFDTLGLEPDEPDVARIAIRGAHYRECLKRYDVHRSDGEIRIEGDSHFAFLVPEAAFEDTQLAEAMLQADLLTHRFLACLSMVDFTNPVFSPRRAALLRYVPDEVQGSGEVLAERFVAAVTAANAPPGSPEQEFLANWNTQDYEDAFRERITEYFRALQNGMNDANVVDGWFRLVEHRRRMFRGFKLAEFKLTTPVTNIPEDAPALRMTINGVAEELPMNRFDPPGFVDDLTEEQKDVWSAQVVEWLGKVMKGDPSANDGPRGQFFNALATPPDADQTVATISWNAFPRQVRMSSLSDKQRWRRADASRDVQDEYCEWSVTRDSATRKITRVTFTCEGPEYWEKLAELNPQKVVELYRELISPAVMEKDLFVDGVYDPRNRFNNSTTNGAMHLIQRSNSLFAEIELGAAATIRRLRLDGTEITDAQELIHCSQYGAPERNSDPFIGQQVNELARKGADITINNPIGLYLHAFNPVGWVTPDGADARDFWKFVRGKDDHFVRAVYEVPPERGYVVGDIRIDGRRIEFGAQITDFITIKLEGLATRIGKSTVQPFHGCYGAAAPPGMIGIAAAEAVEAAQPALATRATSAAFAPTYAQPADEAVLERLPAALRRDAELVEEAAPPSMQPYPRLPDELLVPRMVSGKIMAYASPDSTYAVTKKLLDAAQDSIVIGIYDFRADYVKAHLKKAMQRGVRVTLMLDTNDADEPGLFKELRALGATCVRAPSDSAGHPSPYFGNAHEKIIVIDGEIVMIQSGNWSENSIPFNEGDGVATGHFAPGNRDMGVAVHSRSLAKFFADLVARDIRLALGQPIDEAPPMFGAAEAEVAAGPAAAIFFEAAPQFTPPLFKSLTVTPSTPVSITPVITPENFHDVAKNFLASAKRSIYIEQQYIRGGQSSVEDLLRAIAKARKKNPDLDIRIIVSPKYLTGEKRAKFLKAMNDFKLDFDDHWRFLPLTHFEHCHNKLIVVDEERVLVGSQNWSWTGLLTNREASLLVDHAGISAYFADIFESDWRLAEPSDQPPFALAPEAIVTADAFAEGGVVTSSVRDYVDV